MAYTKQNFKDGDILSASQLNKMDEELARVSKAADNATNQITTVNWRVGLVEDDLEDARDEISNVSDAVDSVSQNVAELQSETTTLQKQADDTQRSLDALWKLSKGQIYDIEQVECEGHAQLPTGGEFGNIDEAYGKTEQESTEGRQLLDWGSWRPGVTKGTGVLENNGITLTATENDCYTNYYVGALRVPVAPGEVVTISWQADSDAPGLTFIFPNGLASGAVYASNATIKHVSYKVKDEDEFVTFRFGVQNAGTTIRYSNIMLEKDSIAHPWEPYTGGIPSPNPDYPQEIKSVEEIRVKKVGRQMLLRPQNDVVYSTSGVTAAYRASDGAIIFNGTATGSSATIAIPHDWFQVEPGTQYTLSMTPRSAYSDKKIYLQYWGSNTGDHKANNSNGYVSFTTSIIEDPKLNIGFGVTAGEVYDNYIMYPMLERGSVAHPYEPYYEETRTIIPPRPLNAIGEYRDTCDVVEGVWKYSLSTCLLKELSWIMPIDGHPTFRAYIANFPKQPYRLLPNLMSETYHRSATATTNAEISDSGDMIVTCHGAYNGVFINDSRFSDANSFRNSFDNEELLYQADAAESIPISSSDLSYLRDLTLLPGENLFITDNHGRDVSYLMSDIINLGKVGESK